MLAAFARRLPTAALPAPASSSCGGLVLRSLAARTSSNPSGASSSRSVLSAAAGSLGERRFLPHLPLSLTMRNLSSGSSARQALGELLQREHSEELDNGSLDVPDELQQLKDSLVTSQGWKIVDQGAITKLYKSVGSLKVQVTFHCQDTVDLMDDVYNDMEEEVGGDEDDEEATGPVRFNVTLTKAGQSLVLTCLSEDGLARIQGVATSKEDVDAIQSVGGVSSCNYQGPVFDELAEDLQESFHDFLRDDVGINGDVAAFVSMHADYREQAEYVQFLQDAKSLLS